MGHFRKVCRTKRNHVVHEVEIEVGPDSQRRRHRYCEYQFIILKQKMVTNNGKLGNTGG